MSNINQYPEERKEATWERVLKTYKRENQIMTDKRIEILEMVADDMENDAEEFDGKPFNGRTVAEYFGNHGAAITALAHILKSILEEKEQQL